MLSVEERRNKLEELLDRVKRNRGCLPEERSTADATQAEETREAIEVESIQPSVTSQPSAMVPSMEKEDSIPTVLQTHEAPIEFTPAPILKTDAEDLPPLDESEPEEIAEPELLETESEAFEAELEPIEAEPEPYEPEPEILEPEQETLEVELEPLEVELEPIEEEPVVLEPEQETLEVEPEPLEVELEPIEEEPVVLEP
ncbi:MAG: hypothetical protein GY847_30960, partial [Proteobacteria bacterium]|nr:hypothetical protein [Pseudomonadota bacterium]